MAPDLALLLAAAERAGRLALTYFGRAQQTWAKGADSVVSEADMAVDAALAAELMAARPDYGWLSEETADSPDRLGRARVFVVDPIDGTRAFIAGRPEWCVSLAVVEDGRPVAGVVAAPALGETWTAVAGEGAFRDGRRLGLSAPAGLAGARISGPRRFTRATTAATGLAADAVRYIPSLAYRLSLVADGRLEAAIARADACDWDIAAADLILAEAGGMVADFSGRRPAYNRPDPRHPPLIATTPALFAALAAIVRAVPEPEPEPPA